MPISNLAFRFRFAALTTITFHVLKQFYLCLRVCFKIIYVCLITDSCISFEQFVFVLLCQSYVHEFYFYVFCAPVTRIILLTELFSVLYFIWKQPSMKGSKDMDDFARLKANGKAMRILGAEPAPLQSLKRTNKRSSKFTGSRSNSLSANALSTIHEKVGEKGNHQPSKFIRRCYSFSPLPLGERHRRFKHLQQQVNKQSCCNLTLVRGDTAPCMSAFPHIVFLQVCTIILIQLNSVLT